MHNKSHWVVRLLYNNNPFYLISGLIILYALNSNVPGVSDASRLDNSSTGMLSQCIQLAGWMGGYAILMAVTAILVVRVAKIWEDARTIYLIVILAVVGMSVVFDQLCVQSWNVAAGILATGFVFAIILIELTLKVSGLRLPGEFKKPFYLLLLAFFGMPVLLSSRLSWIESCGDLNVLLFPVVSSLVLLGLLPAIRRGRELGNNNGSPWIWPYYPWSLFVILFVAILFRSSALAVSFGPMADNSLFLSPLFYLPLVLVLLVLLLEMAFAEGLEGMKSGVLFCSPVLLLMGWGAEALQFQSALLEGISTGIAKPIVISAWCLIGFLGYCFQRGLVSCRLAASVSIAFASFSTSQSPVIESLPLVSGWTLPIIAAIPMVIEVTYAATGKQQTEFGWISSGAFAGFWTMTLFYGTYGIELSLVMGWIGTIGFWLVAGLFFDTERMKLIRSVCGISLGVGMVALLGLTVTDRLNSLAAGLLSTGALLIALVYWRVSRRRGWKGLALFNGASCLMVQVTLLRGSLFQVLADSQNLMLLGGVLCFGFGALITMIKAGAFSGFKTGWNRPAQSWIPGF